VKAFKKGAITLLALSLVALSSPYSVSLAALTKNVDILYVDEDGKNDVEEMVKKAEDSRGEEIGINLDIVDKKKVAENDISGYEAFIFKTDNLNSSNKKVIQFLVEEGKRVYLFGEALSISKASKIFGANLEPSEDEVKKKPLKKEYKDQKHDVIGIEVENGTVHPFYGDIEIEDGIEEDFMKLNLIISDLTKDYESDLITKNTAAADAQRVDSVQDHFAAKYVGSKLIGEVNNDYIVYQDVDEKDEELDYWALKTVTTVKSYNGAKASAITYYKDLVYSSDDLEDSDPGDTSSDNSFSIALYPPGLSYSFSTSSSVKVNHTEDTSDDDVKWVVTPAGLRTSFDTPFNFNPGISWFGSPGITSVDVETKTNFDYNYQTYTLEMDRRVTYSY